MALLDEVETRGFERAGIACGVEKRILYLDEADRKLLQLTLHGRLTRREAAMLVGIASGTVTRRIHRLLARLHDPLVVVLAENGKLLPELHQEVGLAYFLRRWPMGRIGREFDLSVHEVRRMLQYVRGWSGGMRGS
jgi:DNA-directed RNA polymerase specialized sigma24 family protein